MISERAAHGAGRRVDAACRQRERQASIWHAAAAPLFDSRVPQMRTVLLIGDGRTFGTWATPLDDRDRVTSTASVSVDLPERRTRERDLLELVRASSAASRTTWTTVSARSLPGSRCF